MAINPKLLQELRDRREVARNAGGADKLKKRHERGQLAARERLEIFFEEGTFQEFGMHAQHSCKRFGLENKSLPYDGVVCGTGLVNGRAVAAYAQDFTIGGGALGRIHAKKICDLMDFAVEAGMPVVGNSGVVCCIIYIVGQIPYPHRANPKQGFLPMRFSALAMRCSSARCGTSCSMRSSRRSWRKPMRRVARLRCLRRC